MHDCGAISVIVGFPRTLAGAVGPAAQQAQDYARRLASRVAPVPVFLVDERLTTVSAERALRAAGRDARRRRSVTDQAAAAALLQTVLEAEAAGNPIGEPVS